MKPLKPWQWLLLGVTLAAVAYGSVALAGRTKRGNGLPAPQYQPAPEDPEAMLRDTMTAPDGYSRVCLPEEHHAGYTYTPHRYPRSVGGEVSTLIHRGWSSMRVPNSADVQWMISPPSEAAW